jgi:hypothetical protein
MSPLSSIRTPYTTDRSKTVPSKSRLHPGRLSRTELEDLLAEDEEDQA